MWCLSESTVAFCFLWLKFGLDFPLDPNEQGTPGSSLRFEMSFDELDVSPVALRYHACGWDGILRLAFWNGSGYQDPGVPSAYGGATSDAVALVFIMLVAESLSNLDRGRTWKIWRTIYENSVG